MNLQLLRNNHTKETVSFFLYSTILRSFVTPRAVIMNEVHSRLNNTQGKFVIAMHLRCGAPMADFRDQANFLNRRDILSFQRCVKEELELYHNHSMLFVASDSSKAKRMIELLNTDIPVWYDKERPRHTMTRKTRSMKTNHLISSFTDMIMLSKADLLVGTARSTFSLTAGAFKGEIPRLVYTKKKGCSVPTTIHF